MVRRVAFAALSAALVAHLALTAGPVAVGVGVTDAVYLAIQCGAVLLTAARAIAVARNRLAWG